MLHPYDPTLLSSSQYAALMDEARREAAHLRRQAIADFGTRLAHVAVAPWRQWRERQDAAETHTPSFRLAGETPSHC